MPPFTSAPMIETERLRLRAHKVEDVPALAAMWTEPAVLAYFGGKPVPAEDIWLKLLTKIGHWATLGYGYWLVESRSDADLVGEVGFAEMKRAIEPPFGDAPEIGWAIRSKYHGGGYASEAVAAILPWGREHFGPVRSVCLIHQENAPSLKLAKRFGYVEYARAEYKDANNVLLAREL